MPQDIRVLQCFDCKTYQTDIVKKSKKWKCRLCGVQQTVRKELFRGTGAECRIKTQELNMQKGCQQNNDLNQLLSCLNDEETSDMSNCSISPASDVEDEEIIWSTNDKAQENVATVAAYAPNDLKTSKENKNLFNFANTQKWSKDKSAQKSHKLLNTDHDDGSAKKKSKWDNYV